MKCHIPRCLGHADERTAEVTCTRCQGQRWTLVQPSSAPDPTNYLCIRCQAVRSGRKVVDPMGTDGQRKALETARQSHPGRFGPGNQAPQISNLAPEAPTPFKDPLPGGLKPRPGGTSEAIFATLIPQTASESPSPANGIGKASELVGAREASHAA